jgi:hypothetical protein
MEHKSGRQKLPMEVALITRLREDLCRDGYLLSAEHRSHAAMPVPQARNILLFEKGESKYNGE